MQTIVLSEQFKENTITDDRRVQQQQFLHALEEVHARLWRYAEAISKNRHDAEDIVSETILIAYKQFSGVEKKESFSFYLFTIARRLHKKRMWKRRLFGEIDAEEYVDALVDSEATPDTRADFPLLYAALDKLPSKMKEALVLFELSDFSLEEIRRIQGGSLSGVKARVARGREKLALLLGERQEEV